MSTYGSITIDGSLSDWNPVDRIDLGTGVVPGFRVYGKVVGGALVLALQTDGRAIAANTTFWLNTDLNTATGQQIFGFAGGAEYRIEYDGSVFKVYGGGNASVLIPAASFEFAFGSSSSVLELAISLSDLGGATAADLMIDVNENVYLPADYALPGYRVDADPAPVAVGDLTLDGSLADWTPANRIDGAAPVASYEVYGKAAGDSFVFAIKSPIAFTGGTTIWLNTDENTSSGYQIFGFAGGAEYNINFDQYGAAALYSGAAGDHFIANLTYRYAPDMKTVEVAVQKSLIGAPTKVGALIDVNDAVFVPGNYSGPQYTITDSSGLPPRVDANKKVAIVYSETSANKYFDLTAYSQLFMAAQAQALMAGAPFDILTETDLKDINILKEYDALIFPSFRNVKAADYAAIADALESAVNDYHVGIIAAGDFMTNNENDGLISADPYSIMRNLLDVNRIDGGFPANVTLRAGDITHAITDAYTAAELIRSYTGVGWSAFDDVSGQGVTLVTQTIGSNTYNAAIATQTGGRNVHFSSEAVMGDNNLLWQAIDWAVNGADVSVGLQMSRQTSIVASRNDMDQAQEAGDVDPAGSTPGIYDRLLPILQEWKDLYNFVGSYYIDIGFYPTEQQTNWAVSSVYYQQMLAMGNEIGSHSYTHPEDTNLLLPNVVTQAVLDDRIAAYQALTGSSARVYTPYVLRDDADPAVVSQLAALTLAQINSRIASALASANPSALSAVDKALLESTYTFQFAQSKALIEQQLGITLSGAAVPGAPEKLAASLAMLPFYDYLSGGYSGVGAGYPGAIGYITPGVQDHVYLAPNMSFDFTLIDWLNKTPAQALAAWLAEFAALTSHADVPVVIWPWHDYGPTEWVLDGSTSEYTKAMFTNFIAAAFNAGAEFVTLADLAKRISSFEKSAVSFSQVGAVITATVTSTDAGKFALDLDNLGSQKIVSVAGWYAYDEDSVFLPRNGGAYNITLGAAPADVTHIITLPSRAELVSLTGDGRSLNFTVNGEGKLVVDLKDPTGRVLDVQGATIVSLAGDKLTLNIGSIGSHTVTVTLNAPVSITSDGGGTTASVGVAENSAAVTTVTASDLDAPDQAIAFSIIGGADAALFTIDPATGALAFVTAPNFEAPTDADGNNVYVVVVRASDGIVHDEQTISVTVSNVNEQPTISSGGAVSVAENETAVMTVTATDPDAGATLTFSIAGGADAALFAIDASTGALSFLAPANFETPGDANADNVYDVVVRASDGSLFDTKTLAITVTDANEAPVIGSNGGGASATISIVENAGTALTTVAASDPDAGASITYAIAGGADAALFAIDPLTGALSFLTTPDFESPADANADNIYDVIVRASDGALHDEQAIAVSVTDVNEAPAITSNGGGDTASISVAENLVAVTIVAATDVDGGTTLTYSIAGGADAALFSIDALTGALTFITARDFEIPGDAGGDNIYDVVVRASDGALFDEQTLAITVTDTPDAPPVITSDGGGATASLSIVENTSAVTTVAATDADLQPLTYSIAGGADAALFAIDATTGVLSFIAAPDFELPSDADSDNIYDVVVRASDGALFDEQSIAVTVANALDAVPVITSGGGGATASVSLAENIAAAMTVTATDADLQTLTYSIVGGADAALFTIDAVTGALSFVTAPNFEAPGDAGGDNIYDVIVRASDGALFDEQSIAFTITNANETPVITSNGGAASASISMPENTIAVTTVAATDPDAGTTLTYSISGGADAALFTIDPATGALSFLAQPDAEAPADANADNIYDVIVRASDGALFAEQALAINVLNIGEAPVITSGGGGATASAPIAENTTAVTTVVAIDADPASIITYSISGGADAALFAIDATTGALRFLVAPNYEQPADANADNTYEVVVRASDGALFDEQTISVPVTNANETPTFAAASLNVSVAENTTAAATIAATDPDAGTTLAYSIAGGADAALFAINAVTGALSFVAAPNYEAPADANADNIYDVVVRASDGALFADQTVAVTVQGVNEAPSIVAGGPSVSAAENQTAVVTIGATDPDAGATITYSIVGGADAARFVINAATGVLSFVAPLDFEASADADHDNIYDVVVRASDGALHADRTLAVTLTDAPETPVITSDGGGASAAVTISENQTAVTTVQASDPDVGTTLVYSIVGGADAALFAIDSATGALSFITAPNFEAPGDAGANNVYDVIVRASDGSLFDDQALAVSVANANEAPVITSNGGGASAAVSVAENNTAVATVAATDVDAATTLSYAIIGGADAALFAINAATGALSFVTAPNFEAPGDVDHNNVYDVVVRASDGSLFDTQSFGVTVTDVAETPVITSNGGGDSAAITLAEGRTAVTNVVAADPDAGTSLTYTIAGGADAALFAINNLSGALFFVTAPNFDTPADANKDNVYNVVVRASDGFLFDEQTMTVSITDDPNYPMAPGSNSSPGGPLVHNAAPIDAFTPWSVGGLLGALHYDGPPEMNFTDPDPYGFR